VEKIRKWMGEKEREYRVERDKYAGRYRKRKG